MCADDLRSEALCHQPGSDAAQAQGPVQSACPVGSQRWSPHSESPEGKITDASQEMVAVLDQGLDAASKHSTSQQYTRMSVEMQAA